MPSPQASTSNQESVYRARVTSDFQIFILGMGVLLAGCILLAVLLTASVDPEAMKSPVLLLSLGLAGLSLVFVISMMTASTYIRLEGTSVKVTAGGLASIEFDLSEVEQVQEGPRTGLAQGMGSRVLGSGHTGYLTGGYSIDFFFKDGKRITVSCDDPDAALADIRGRMEVGAGE